MTPEELARLEALEVLFEQYRNSTWTGKVDNGGYPRTPVRDQLPEASSLLSYALVTIRGTPDITYQCLRNSTGTWGWRQVVTGGT